MVVNPHSLCTCNEINRYPLLKMTLDPEEQNLEDIMSENTVAGEQMTDQLTD